MEPFRYRYEGDADTESTQPETFFIDTDPLTEAELNAGAQLETTTGEHA